MANEQEKKEEEEEEEEGWFVVVRSHQTWCHHGGFLELRLHFARSHDDLETQRAVARRNCPYLVAVIKVEGAVSEERAREDRGDGRTDKQ